MAFKNKEVEKEYYRKYYLEHREEKIARACENGRNNKERRRINERARNRRVKKEVFAHYGGECVCCGESELIFLTMDHINGGGNKHRKEIFGHRRGAGSATYHWIKRNDFPEYFQILCWNCNSGKHLNGGICPHEKLAESAEMTDRLLEVLEVYK